MAARLKLDNACSSFYGPEVLLILGCYALPASYAAADGVQVVSARGAWRMTLSDACVKPPKC